MGHTECRIYYHGKLINWTVKISYTRVCLMKTKINKKVHNEVYKIILSIIHFQLIKFQHYHIFIYITKCHGKSQMSKVKNSKNNILVMKKCSKFFQIEVSPRFFRSIFFCDQFFFFLKILKISKLLVFFFLSKNIHAILFLSSIKKYIYNFYIFIRTYTFLNIEFFFKFIRLETFITVFFIIIIRDMWMFFFKYNFEHFVRDTYIFLTLHFLSMTRFFLSRILYKVLKQHPKDALWSKKVKAFYYVCNA